MNHTKPPSFRSASLWVCLCLIVPLFSTFSARAGDVGETPEPAKPLGIAYRLAMPKPSSHLFEVSVELTRVSTPTVDLSMPAWSPGRYAIYDFAKNVQEFESLDGQGKRLKFDKTDKQTWRVETAGNRSLTVRYKVYAANLSGTFSVLDEQHANYNGASVFMYVVGYKPNPVRLTLDLPPGWKAMGGAVDAPDQREFAFPNYDLLIDSPMELGDAFEVFSFEHDGRTYRVCVNQLGERDESKSLVEGVEKIVRAHTSMFPTPDFKHYTFLFNFAPGQPVGDGMEHLNSTQIVVSGRLADPGVLEDALSTASHEFFHAWNVKRIRPVELGPWDYSREVHTKSLWIAEGLTNYYGDLGMARSGLHAPELFYVDLVRQINMYENRSGRKLMSAEQSSWDSWFHIGAPSMQATNLHHTTISYYNKGELIGLLLDLEIRARTDGKKSLDDVFRYLYYAFYEQPAETYYLKGKGYRSEDFLKAVNQVAGSDFTEFFSRYVQGVDEPDYNRALGHVGLKLASAPGEPVRIAEIENPTGKQRTLRAAWLTGTRTNAAAVGAKP